MQMQKLLTFIQERYTVDFLLVQTGKKILILMFELLENQFQKKSTVRTI